MLQSYFFTAIKLPGICLVLAPLKVTCLFPVQACRMLSSALMFLHFALMSPIMLSGPV